MSVAVIYEQAKSNLAAWTGCRCAHLDSPQSFQKCRTPEGANDGSGGRVIRFLIWTSIPSTSHHINPDPPTAAPFDVVQKQISCFGC
jgi:hypothetical protein